MKIEKQLFSLAILCLILQAKSYAQSIKLNNEGDPGSAMLEVNSASKGILIPNVALTGITDVTTITLPAVSLLVYNTATVSDVEPGYYYNSGTAVSPVWTRLSTGTSTGTAGDGSETKVTAGTNVTITGSGTSASPYIVGASSGDGSETKVTAGTNVTVTGSGTTGSPYLVDAAGGDGSETKVTAGTNVTVTGSGTLASPYVVNATEVDGDVTNEIQDLSIIENTLKITLNSAATAIDLSSYLDNTDDQTLDVSQLVGTNLELSLDGDGESTKIIDLSALQDGTGTDDQTLIEILTPNTSAGSKQITNLADPTNAQDAATKKYVDENDDINDADSSATNEIQDLSINENILKITLNGSPTAIDLSPYLDNTDTQLTEVQVDSFVNNNGYLTTHQDLSSYATNSNLDLKAPKESPTFTGTPTLPTGTVAVTQSANNNSTAVATTAYVDSAISSFTSISTTTTDYTVLTTDNYIIYTGASTGTITLPTAAGASGKEYIIKNMTAYEVTIATTSSEQIWQDANNKTVTVKLGVETQNNWMKIVSDGTQWISFRALY